VENLDAKKIRDGFIGMLSCYISARAAATSNAENYTVTLSAVLAECQIKFSIRIY
jgi:hypothetical protein